MSNSLNIFQEVDLSGIEGVGFDTATDSLVKIRDEQTLIEGAGFVTGADALTIIKDRTNSINDKVFYLNFTGNNVHSEVRDVGVLNDLSLAQVETAVAFPGCIMIEDATTSLTLVDAVNVTGKGQLYCIVQTNLVDNVHCKITLDGVVACDESLNISGLKEWRLNKQYPIDTFMFYPDVVTANLTFSVMFGTSLRIQHKAASGATSQIKIWYSFI